MSKAIPPLSSIKDPATRAAIQALAEGAGGTGSGPNERYITIKELEEGAKTGGGPLGQFFNGMFEHLLNTRIMRHLSERIAWIEMPEWFQGKFGAAIREEQILREEATSALAENLTTAVTNINGNIALAQERLTATSDELGATAEAVTQLQVEVVGADGKGGIKAAAQELLKITADTKGKVEGTWSVKFDVDGYVAGVGLGLEGGGGTPFRSTFGVNADNFVFKRAGLPFTPFGYDAASNTFYVNGQMRIGSGGGMSLGDAAATLDIVYLRSASQPATPSNSTASPPSGWKTHVNDALSQPGATGPLWSSVGTKSALTNVWVWDTPVRLEGTTFSEVTVYTRSANAPGTPSGGTYSFATGTIIAPPTGWSSSIPSGTDPCWASTTTAASDGNKASVTLNGWSTPVKVFQEGSDGANGAIIYAYKRTASPPNDNPGAVTYDFASKTITTTLANGWSKTIPAGSDPLYVTAASASSADATDTIAANEWSSPVLFTENGINAATIFLFRRTTTSTPPSPPGSTTTYTFATKTLSGDLGGWSQSLPTTGGNYRWTTTATAASSAATDTIPPSEWATPALLSQDGADGDPGSWVTYVFKTAATKPTDFPTSASGGNGWTDGPTVSGTLPIWMRKATVSGKGVVGTWSNPVQINGKDGASVYYEYAIGTATYVSGSWGTSIPTVTLASPYLWMRAVTKNADGTLSYGTAFRVTGEAGPAGKRGAQTYAYNGNYSYQNLSSLFASGMNLSDKIPGDAIRFNNGDTYTRTPTNLDQWLKAALVVTGDMIVTGTISVDRIETNRLDAKWFANNAAVLLRGSAASSGYVQPSVIDGTVAQYSFNTPADIPPGSMALVVFSCNPWNSSSDAKGFQLLPSVSISGYMGYSNVLNLRIDGKSTIDGYSGRDITFNQEWVGFVGPNCSVTLRIGSSAGAIGDKVSVANITMYMIIFKKTSAS